MTTDKKLPHGFSNLFSLEDAETSIWEICKLRN
jgi:hypothetical protein